MNKAHSLLGTSLCPLDHLDTRIQTLLHRTYVSPLVTREKLLQSSCNCVEGRRRREVDGRSGEPRRRIAAALARYWWIMFGLDAGFASRPLSSGFWLYRGVCEMLGCARTRPAYHCWVDGRRSRPRLDIAVGLYHIKPCNPVIILSTGGLGFWSRSASWRKPWW
jgi:hypothetical protein